MIDIAELTAGIKPLNENAKRQARNHFDDLIKPKGSLAFSVATNRCFPLDNG